MSHKIKLDDNCKIRFVQHWELRHQGAESRLYFGLHSNNPCVVKQRFDKRYRIPPLDRKLKKERTKRERRMIEKIQAKSKDLGPYMPKVIWSDDSVILMSEITNCQTVSDFIERNPSEASSIVPLIGQCIAQLHNIGIIHGDLTTLNLLLVPRMKSTDDAPSKKIKSDCISESHIVIPIDFGLSTGSYHYEERAVDLYVLERTLLATHFSDAEFFKSMLDAYMDNIDEKFCEPPGKHRIIERLKEVRARGRKSDYADEPEL